MRLRGHRYPLSQMMLMVTWLLSANVSLRGASTVCETLREQWELSLGVPHYTTARWWLLRLGYYKLCRVKEHADDWVWMIDHSIQIGPEKCLVILGVRLCHLPQPGECLRHEHVEIIDLIPVSASNKTIVDRQLRSNVCKTGVPRAIVHDRGADLAGGLKLFRTDHPETSEIYDITHKAACVLKARLAKDETWKAFCTRIGQTKFQIQQTELAFLVPPSQRSKARYMNLGSLISWGSKTLRLVAEPPAEVLQYCTAERLEEKLGWLREYVVPLQHWSQMQQVIDVVEHFVRTQGLSRDAPQGLAKQLEPLELGTPAQSLREELQMFVESESSKAREGERLPGSTEVLESCFGKFKSLERDQIKGGFTSLLLSVAAIVSETNLEVMRQAIEFCTTAQVRQWVSDNLGPTFQSKRRLAYRAAA